MKKLITSCTFLVFVLLMSACKNEKSLQSYLVDASGKEGYFTGDIPVSSVLTPKSEVSEETKEVLSSIKKINVVYLQKTADNSDQYEAEKAKLKAIFKDNSTYKSLGKMKAKGMNVNVYYAGNTDAVDEVVAFGYSNEAGVGVARLLGENMNPSKIMEILNDVQMEGNANGLGPLGKIINGI